MYIVYILRSVQYPNKHYVGLTQDLDRRLLEHNSGHIGYSGRYAPWFVETVIGFQVQDLAVQFEKYLKRGSGHAFLKKHFIS